MKGVREILKKVQKVKLRGYYKIIYKPDNETNNLSEQWEHYNNLLKHKWK